MFRWVVLGLICLACVYGSIVQYGKKNIKVIIWLIVGAIATGLIVNYIFKIIDSYLPYPTDSIVHMSTTNSREDLKNIEMTAENEEDIDSFLSSETILFSREQETDTMNYLEDITGKTVFSGSIVEEGQKNNYKFTSKVAGTYHFSSDLSAGGEIRVRICGENGESIDYGTNALTIDLQADKIYVISIEYKNGPCDFTINIGIPIVVNDITGNASVSGNISYEDKKDKYLYTASIDGTYHFGTNLSAGGEVKVRISGENGNSINYGYNGLTIDLEAGKTYILSIEYYNNICDYVVNIGVPIEVNDITGSTSVSGSISYQDKKDKYCYTAAIDGTYRFDTNLSTGGEVKVRISGENGKSINYGYNGLTIDLEAGKTYILSVEYYNGICDYVVNMGVPTAIQDITGSTSVSGSITYQDQKDRYLYTAPINGTYCFNTNLSSGAEVRVRISGENGNPIKYGYNGLTIDLEAGKTYILSVEYQTLCSYEVFIEFP